MNRFCGSCGAPLQEGAGFCGSCGTSTQQASATSPAYGPVSGYQPVNETAPASPSAPPAFQPVAQSTVGQGGATAAPVVKSSNTWVKVVVVLLIVLFAVGAAAVGGVIYVAHKVSQKAQEYKREILGETSPATPGTATAAAPAVAPAADPAQSSSASAADGKGASAGRDACRLLSKEDVSRAIGVTVLETLPTDDGCSYLAKGTSVSMTSKHAAAMMGAHGADKKTQGMFEQFAGAVGGSMPKNEASENDRPDGTTIVLAFGLDTNNAEDQMKLNAKVLGFGGIGNIDAIDGIGDEAFSKADSMMFVRKGDTLIRIMYTTCPCGTEAIKPLAKKIVANL